MSDVVEQLRAQAVQLRHGLPGLGAVPQQAEWDSLAVLIDGVLAWAADGKSAEYLSVLIDADPYELSHVMRRERGVILERLPALQLLARHVSAVLSGCTQTAREGR